MARSVWKGPFVDGYLLAKAETSRNSGRNEIIRIWSRRSTILPQFVGLTFGVYNGHKFPAGAGERVWSGINSASSRRPRTFTGHVRTKGEAGLMSRCRSRNA